MIQTVLKRDGRVVGFNEEKIVAAVRRAMLHTDKGEDMQLAHEIADRIACRGQEQMSVEDIQNCVEIELMKSRRKDVAQLYIAYRNQRSVARKAKTRDIFLEIIETKSNEVTRENANMNADTPAGMMMKFSSETTKPFVDDYLLVEEVKKPALPESKECELVARELAKNQVEKISDVRSRLNMTWLQIWPIICYMEEQGILEKGKEGTVTLTRTPEQVEELVDSQQWKQLFGEEEAKRRSTGSSQETEEKMQVIRRIQKEKRNNPGVNAITIDQKLVYEETEHHIKTRIPYRKNEFIWLDKSEISWINDHKTIFAGLEKKKEYAILDLEDRFLRKTSGEDLYRESYDPVHRERARQEQEKIRRRREQNYRKAQQNLEAGRRTIQGQRR